MMSQESDVVEITRSYYNSQDADEFYFRVWGGEDIHIGIYSDHTSIATASRRTVEKMASMLTHRGSETQLLDLGSGFGGPARYLAGEKGWKVTCLNISEKQNERARELNQAAGLDHRISVHWGNIEEIPFEDMSFDVIWSEDAMVHSANKDRVLREAFRALKPGGDLIFTDLMQVPDIPADVLAPVLARIHLHSMGSFEFYDDLARRVGFVPVEKVDLSSNLAIHYATVKDEMLRRRGDLDGLVSQDYMDRMLLGLDHWVNAARDNYLTWGILHFQRPA